MNDRIETHFILSSLTVLSHNTFYTVYCLPSPSLTLGAR